jgi:hypothetical protein
VRRGTIAIPLRPLLAAIACLTACASDPPPAPAPSAARALGAEFLTARLRDPFNDIGRRLAPFANRPVEADAALLESWRRAGFRLVLVPADQVLSVIDGRSLVAPVQRREVGVLARRSVIIAGRNLPERSLIDLHDGTRELEFGGRPRLLGRTWIAPGPVVDGVVGARLRLNLVPQLADLNGPSMRLRTRAASGSPTPEIEGGTIEDLALSVDIGSADALVIVSESPETLWESLPPRALPTPAPLPPVSTALSRPDDFAGADAPWVPPTPEPPKAEPFREPESLGDVPFEGEPVGPPQPAVPTLGDVILSDASILSPARERVVLVIFAHLPARFTLLRD